MQRKTLIMLLLVGAVAAAYGQMARHDFLLWDDPGTVAGNPRLNPPTWSGVMHYWRHPEQGLYIPVTYSAWSILAAAAQLDQPDDRGIRLNPAIFHLANIAVHAATAVGVFLILRQLLSHDWAAASGALLYALHPVQVEAVAWISGLKDVLSGMFAMLALWQYLLFARGDQQHRRRWIHYSLATAALALAMLSKPSAMIVPLMALIIDALVIRRPIKRIALSLGPWFVLAAATALVAKLVQPAIGVPHTPLWARPLIAGDALSFYLYKLIFPLHLAIDYGRRPDVAMQSPAFYLAWIVPVLLGVLLLLFRRRARC